MLELRKSGYKTINGKKKLYYIYLCLFCGKEVEKLRCNGSRQNSCGCNHKFSSGRPIIHNESKSKIYSKWIHILTLSKKYNKGLYKDWQNYILFKIWLLRNGHCDKSYLEIIDINKEIGPDNCVISKERKKPESFNNNKIDFKTVVELRNEYKNLKVINKIKFLSDKYSILYNTMYRIINNSRWYDKDYKYVNLG